MAGAIEQLVSIFGEEEVASGLGGLMDVGNNAQGVMGDKGLTLAGGATPPQALNSLGSGMAPGLGGAPAAPAGAQGGLMDYNMLMAAPTKNAPTQGGRPKSRKEHESFVNRYTQPGMTAGLSAYQDMSSPYGLMNWGGF